MGGGGTEAFPDLGSHCQHKDCNQLDFLPFTCNGCQLVFCLEHRSYKAHRCPKSDHNSRKVVVCELCSVSIETTGHDGDDEKAILDKHEKSGKCDPSKKKKPRCPVKRCKEILTFSNTCTCKSCQMKVCLKHRFPADHTCTQRSSASSAVVASGRPRNDKFLVALASRNNKDCANHSPRSSASKSTSSSVKAY